MKKAEVVREAVFTVTLAGILHDIGHGPSSHLFDSAIIEKDFKVDGKKFDWEHEIASLFLIDDLYLQLTSSMRKENSKKDPNVEANIAWLESTKERVKCLIIGKVTKM